MIRPLLSAVLLSLAACTDLGPEYESNRTTETANISATTATTPTTTTETKTTETSTFSPMAGDWTDTSVTTHKNSCDFQTDKMKFDLTLTNTDVSSFRLQWVDKIITDVWECASSEPMRYGCTSYTTTDAPFPDFDAKLYAYTTPELLFYDVANAWMYLKINLDCVGADCAYLIDLKNWSYPCLSELNIALEHTGP